MIMTRKYNSAPALPADSRGSPGHPAGGAGLAALCSAGGGWLQEGGGGRPEHLYCND